MTTNVPFGPLLSPHRVYQQGGQNQLYVSWPQTCVSKLKKVALEPFFWPSKISRKSHPKERKRKGASTSVFSPRGREISRKLSEGYEDRGASAKPPRGYIAKESRSGGTSLRQCLERVWRQGSCPCTLPPKHACSQRAAACNSARKRMYVARP